MKKTIIIIAMIVAMTLCSCITNDDKSDYTEQQLQDFLKSQGYEVRISNFVKNPEDRYIVIRSKDNSISFSRVNNDSGDIYTWCDVNFNTIPANIFDESKNIDGPAKKQYVHYQEWLNKLGLNSDQIINLLDWYYKQYIQDVLEVTKPQSNSNNTSPSRTEQDEYMSKIVALIKEKKAFDSGNYTKGDIPAGEYVFSRFKGSGAYYCEEDAAGNIIENENFMSFGYVKVHAAGNLENKGVLVSEEGIKELGISGAKELYEKLNNESDWDQSGWYKVGTDIMPGTYLLESTGRGYYAVMTGPVGASKIVKNDNFNGRVNVTVKTGQYLNVSRAIINIDKDSSGNSQVGKTIKFGKYEIDNNTGNGKEDLEWIVLSKNGGEYLVISKDGIDCLPYSTGSSATWETSTLRKWLNENFFNEAFNNEDQNKIQISNVSADKNPNYGTDPGNDTKDRIYLLSCKEFEKYKNVLSSNKCSASDYAIEKGAYNSNENTCMWWLRTPGNDKYSAVFVDNSGTISNLGGVIYYDKVAVRPVMRVKIN